ncbi:MAG: DUF429 domain-containing protein [Alphaproteobacteria bacterium]|nr:DUF429 domain-containing protein [Alphaproteobacteria bacterium]
MSPFVLLAHADWSGARERAAAKRWAVLARRQGRGWSALGPEPVTDPLAFLRRLAEEARAAGGAALFGIDCPIGLPRAYLSGGRSFRNRDFCAFLDALDQPRWARFFDPAGSVDQVSPTRPFFPSGPVSGAGLKARFLERLGLDAQSLLRACDRGGADGVRAACGLFWTLGGNQVGKAAISAWRDLIRPARTLGLPLKLWPFEGAPDALAAPGAVVMAETYPAEAYVRVGLALPSRKRTQGWRTAQAGAIRAWARREGVTLAPALARLIVDGFGPRPEGEDPFDATLGLLGMVPVAIGRHPTGTPSDPVIRRWEGWMLGRTLVPPRPP